MDFPHPCLGNEVEDVGAGPACTDDGNSLGLKLPGEVDCVLASGRGVRKVKNALVIVVVDGDLPLLGCRVRVELAGLTAKNFDVRRYLVVVVLVSARWFG